MTFCHATCFFEGDVYEVLYNLFSYSNEFTALRDFDMRNVIFILRFLNQLTLTTAKAHLGIIFCLFQFEWNDIVILTYDAHIAEHEGDELAHIVLAAICQGPLGAVSVPPGRPLPLHIASLPRSPCPWHDSGGRPAGGGFQDEAWRPCCSRGDITRRAYTDTAPASSGK